MSPRIQVLIPTYNRCAWLREAINSVLECGHADLLVLDNGSTDSTTELLYSISRQEPRVAWRYRPVNDLYGYSYLLDSMQWGSVPYEFFVLFGDDDLMLPGRLTEKLNFMLANPHLDMVFTRVHWMDSARVDRGPHSMGAIAEAPLTAGSLNYDVLMLGDYIPLQSALFRRSFLAHAHTFKIPEFGGCSDWAMLLEAAKAGLQGGFLPTPSVVLGMHDSQVSADLTRSSAYIDHHLAVWAHHAAKGWKPEPWGAYLYLQQFLTSICHKSEADAIPALVRLKELYESR